MTSDKYFDIAEKFFLKGEYEKALRYFNKSNEIKVTDESLNYIGCCYLWLDNLESAEKVFCKLIETDSSWERPIFNLGRVYLKLGRLDDALQCIKKALTINPNEDDINFYMGVTYYKLDEYQKAKEFYEKSLSINNKLLESHLNLGMCYFRLKNYENALEEFEIAYLLDNNCLDAVYNKGIALISMNKYHEALENLLVVNNLKPDDIETMMEIAHCYYKTEDYRNSNIWIKKVLGIDPQNSLANKLLKRLSSLTQ